MVPQKKREQKPIALHKQQQQQQQQLITIETKQTKNGYNKYDI
jgi:hypothetical protein